MIGGFQQWFEGIFGLKQIYRPGAVIQLLKVERKVIYRALIRAELEGIRFRRVWLIPRPALAAWLQEEDRWRSFPNGSTRGLKSDL